MYDEKLLTLKLIDEGFKDLNLFSFDGDPPSPLCGVSLLVNDGNLRQHGKLNKIVNYTLIQTDSICSNADVDVWSLSTPCNWTPHSNRK